MHDKITFMALIKEILFIFNVHLSNLEVFCKLFKDNQSCIYAAYMNTFLPKSIYITIKYQYF